MGINLNMIAYLHKHDMLWKELSRSGKGDLNIWTKMITEPPHDKTNKMMSVQLRLRSAWASAQSDQSLLSPWRNIQSSATHKVHSEDSDHTRWMPRLICLGWAHPPSLICLGWVHVILLVLSCCGSEFLILFQKNIDEPRH